MSHRRSVAAEPPDRTDHEDRQPHDQVQHPLPFQLSTDERIVNDLVEPVQRRIGGQVLQSRWELLEWDGQTAEEGAQNQRDPDDLQDVLGGQQVPEEEAESGEEIASSTASPTHTSIGILAN